jgi:MFS family permease
MSHIIKIYSLLIGSALLMFGGGLQGLVISVRGAEENFSLTALGLIGTGWSIGYIAGSITVPMLVKRVGHIRAYSVMAAIGTITILLNLLMINDIAWIILRGLSGYCFAGAAMIVESWLNEVTDNKRRGTVFSLYNASNMAFSTIGQIAMSITGTKDFVPFVVGAIFFILALLPTALTSKPQPRPLQSARLDLKLLYTRSPVAAISAFAIGMANGTFGTLAAVYCYEQHIPPSEISFLVALPVIAGAASQIPAGRLSDRIDRRSVIIGLSFVAAVVATLLVLLNPGDGLLLYILFGIYGLCAYPLYGIAVAHANDSAKEGEFAKISGGMLLIMGVGLAIGPAIAPFLMTGFRPVGLFIVTATFHGALAISTFFRMRVRPHRRETRGPFQPIFTDKAQSPEVVTLDPRSEDGGAQQAL